MILSANVWRFPVPERIEIARNSVHRDSPNCDGDAEIYSGTQTVFISLSAIV